MSNEIENPVDSIFSETFKLVVPVFFYGPGWIVLSLMPCKKKWAREMLSEPMFYTPGKSKVIYGLSAIFSDAAFVVAGVGFLTSLLLCGLLYIYLTVIG